MSRRVAFLVVAILLCIVLSSQATDVLQCTGERLNNGSFFFNASYDFKEDVHDCETQWLVDGKVEGLCEAGGNVEYRPPIMMATANTAILQTCPEILQCLLICPSGNINEKKQCTCGTTPPTSVPGVGFPDLRNHVWIGASCGLFVILLILAIGIVLYFRRRSRYSRCDTGPAQVVQKVPV